MYSLIMRTTQALCKCNNIEDFTIKGYDEWMKKISTTIQSDTNGSYSLSIKKSFIIKFTSISQRFFMKINKLMSQQINTTNDNYKLSRYIIQNYNGYQNETYKIHKGKTFYELEYYTDPAYKPYEDIENVQTSIVELRSIIENLNKDFNDISSDENDNKIEEKKNMLLDASNKLSKELDHLRDTHNIFKEMYKTNNYKWRSYDDEFIYKFKNQYIEAHNELHQQKLKTIKSQTETDTDKQTVGFDVKEYSMDYDEINDAYITQYETIYKISNDIYKTEAELSKNRDIEVEEEVYSRSLLSMATTTSQNIYSLFVIYIVLILTANIVE